MFTPGEKHWTATIGSGSRLLTVPLGLAGVLASLTGTAVGLAVLGLAGVGRLLGPALLGACCWPPC